MRCQDFQSGRDLCFLRVPAWRSNRGRFRGVSRPETARPDLPPEHDQLRSNHSVRRWILLVLAGFTRLQRSFISRPVHPYGNIGACIPGRSRLFISKSPGSKIHACKKEHEQRITEKSIRHTSVFENPIECV